MGPLGALFDPQFRKDVRQGFTDAGNRGAVAGLLGGPVDLATMAMRPFGYNVEKPVGGSEWIGKKMQNAGIVSDRRNALAEALAGVGLPAAGVRAAPAVFAAEQALAPKAMDMARRGIEGHMVKHGMIQPMIDKSALQQAFPSVDFSLGQSGNVASLSKIVVPKAERNTGVGSDFMRALAKAADTDGATVALSPAADFGGNKARLIDFYKRFGFVPNKGRNIDYAISESMYRQPAPKPPIPYQIEHKPMTDAGGASRLHDLATSFGDDIYGPNALQYFGSGDAREKTTVKLLQSLRGKPDAQVTVYRGVPSGAKGINAGDWVTLDPKVASEYGNVVSMKVPASHITSWPDSLLEFGYFPPGK